MYNPCNIISIILCHALATIYKRIIHYVRHENALWSADSCGCLGEFTKCHTYIPEGLIPQRLWFQKEASLSIE